MKKKITALLAAAMIVILSCTPVMAGAVTAEAAAAAGSAVTASGTLTTQAAKKNGWVKEGKYYKYYVNGVYYKSSIRKIDGKLYGFSAKGNLCCKWFTINGNKYYGSVNSGPKGIGVGQVLTGYRKIGNDYYYLSPARKGAMATGFVTLSKKLYYFDPSTGKQRRAKGWFYVGNAMYYVQADGTIATNKTIDGRRVGATGAFTDLSGMDKKAQGYSSSTRYLILVHKSEHKVNIYQGSRGNWINIKRNLPCTIGKSSTPSPSGNYKLDHKSSRAYGYKDFSSSTVFYTTRITAGNYFHSILYRLGCRNPYTSSPKDASLGKSKSNSCIRLRLEDAKFIHQVTPKGSRVIVY
ncbi:MAG: L,D-transpeptidase family protein [Eubacteriales bacterium]|nr:hypothetical protein [Sarcina sp.]MDO4417445.1 L,D-transpeptidase family protein [Eubacteriales bacterium]